MNVFVPKYTLSYCIVFMTNKDDFELKTPKSLKFLMFPTL
jgi:hypothetical protein